MEVSLCIENLYFVKETDTLLVITNKTQGTINP